MDQEEYLKWKQSFWGDLIKREFRHPRAKPTHQNQFGFYTKTTSELGHWHKIFYPYPDPTYCGRKPKRFPEEVIPLMTPLALAVWYMDDGCAAYRPTFSAHPDCHAIGQRILAEFGVPTQIRGQYGIEVQAEGVDHFLALVRPHIHPTLEYKLHPTVLGVPDTISTEEFLDLIEKGVPLQGLIQHFKVSRRVIVRKAQLLGVKPSRLLYTEPDLAHLVVRIPTGSMPRIELPGDTLNELAKAGVSMRQMAKRFGIGEHTVERELLRHSIPYTLAGKRGGAHNRCDHITREALTVACAERLMMEELELRFDASREAIRHRVKEWNIPWVSKGAVAGAQNVR